MTIRNGMMAVVWLVAGALALSAGRLHLSPDAPSGLPEVGDAVDLAAVEAAFDEEPGGLAVARRATGSSWLLVLTSGCSACLRLDVELAALRDQATCRGATLVPLVVREEPLDSIRAVLGRHGLEVGGVAGSNGLRSLGVGIVPTLVELSPERRVEAVRTPARGPEWWQGEC